MPKTVAQIREQIAKLQQQEQAALQREIDAVVKKIRVAVEHYGITAEQIFGKGGAPAKKVRAQRKAGRVKTERTSKVVGKRAKAADAAPASEPKKRVSAAKGIKVAVRFRDDAGNAWSGRGSQPRWLRAALESGRKLEEFAAA